MPRAPYPLSNISDPHLQRVLQDMVDRQSFLEREIERLGGSIPIGMAKRESPVEGIITIPYRDHGGRDGSVRVSRDGVISSYVNPVESLFPYTDLRTIGNITTGLDPLHSFTLPAGTLANNGDSIKVHYFGSFAANANTKRIQLNFDGTSAINLAIVQNGGGWDYDVTYTRSNPISILVSGQFTWNFATPVGGFVNTAFGSIPGGFAVANLNTTDVILLVQAEGTATDDIVQTLTHIEYYRARTVRTT